MLRPYSVEEIAFIREWWHAPVPIHEIASYIERSKASVQCKAAELKLGRRKNRNELTQHIPNKRTGGIRLYLRVVTDKQSNFDSQGFLQLLGMYIK